MKIVTIVSMLFLFALLPTHTLFCMKQKVVNEAELKQIAEEQGYGYKYANLVELDKLVQRVNKKLKKLNYSFAVPIFVGISSDKIQRFLAEYGDFNLADRWLQLITKFFNSEEVQQQAITTKTFPEGFMAQRENLEHEVRKKFDAIINKTSEQAQLDTLFKVPKIDDLVMQMHEQGQRLMVRSTGKEDTKTLANAGGNESISNVEPTTIQILNAMREVVASYVGSKSVTQRLGAGDKSLLDPKPFTPVLIQRMIGETQGQLPKCGVMFTEETEGGISKLNESKTSGITVIQCAYGHNEGVVNSLIPVDTFYVDKNDNIYPIIRPKTYRMAPDLEKKRSLHMVENDKSVIKQAALNQDAVKCLKILAQELEQWYQGPMDVEFVVKEDEQTIYIVQARPIVHKTNLPPASYLLNVDQLNPEAICKGQSIGVAGGSIRICTGKQIIATESIGAALAEYQKPGNAEAITCIIVGKMAPSTSHEATTFRSEGKPVICIPDWQKIVEWAKQNHVVLVIDLQQGLVVKWQGEEHSVDELIASKMAMLGWCTYPIPRLISLEDGFVAPVKLDNDFIAGILPEDVNTKTFFEQASKTNVSMKDLLDHIKKAPEHDARIELALLLNAVVQARERAMHGFVLDKDYMQRIPLFESYVATIAQRIVPVLIYESTDVLHYSQRLFPIRFLEALIYQQPQPSDAVNGISAATLIGKELFGEQKIRKMLAERGITLDDRSIQYLRIADFAFVPELEQYWTDFVINISQMEKSEQNAFAKFIMQLAKFNVLPVWLNTQFAQLYKPVDDMTDDMKKTFATSTAKTMIKDYTSQKDFLRKLNEYQTKLHAFNLNAFENPKSFEMRWASFQNDLLDYFISGEFTQQFDSANNLARIVALGIMTSFVDTFDLSIKALKGSQQYQLEEKLKNFHTMLIQYAGLFKKWVTMVPEGLIKYNSESPLEQYLICIDNTLNKTTLTINDFLNTNEFNVNQFTIGSGVDLNLGLVKPTTLEDGFTTIHQSILALLGALNLATEIYIARPELLALLENQIMNLGIVDDLKDLNLKAALIGTAISHSQTDLLTLSYNIPLRQHSIKIDINYNKHSGLIHLTVNFFGKPEHNRWSGIHDFANFLNSIGVIKIEHIRLYESGINITLQISTAKEIAEISNSLNFMILRTYHAIKIDNIIDEYLTKKEIPEIVSAINAYEKQHGIDGFFENEYFGMMLAKVCRFGEKTNIALACINKASSSESNKLKNASLCLVFAEALVDGVRNNFITIDQIKSIIELLPDLKIRYFGKNFDHLVSSLAICAKQNLLPIEKILYVQKKVTQLIAKEIRQIYSAKIKIVYGELNGAIISYFIEVGNKVILLTISCNPNEGKNLIYFKIRGPLHLKEFHAKCLQIINEWKQKNYYFEEENSSYDVHLIYQDKKLNILLQDLKTLFSGFAKVLQSKS